MTMKKVLILLPSTDFDPSESAIPWHTLSASGNSVSFATPKAKVAACDPIMITGKSLGPLAPVLRAKNKAVEYYKQMEASEEFRSPISYEGIDPAHFDALIIPGGHAAGIREMLESDTLPRVVVKFFHDNKIVASVCHGVLLVARSKNENGNSVLYGRKTTSLLKSQELLAHNLTRLWKGDYYRTYPGITVEEEVKALLKKPSDFIHGPIPLLRDSEENKGPGFCVVDGNYISARWPGDCHTWSDRILKKLESAD